MSSEQTTQETVPVEKTETSTEPVKTEPTTETKPEVTTTTTTTTSSWKESISEQYRNDPNIEKFTEIDALAKSYINATKMIGKIKLLSQLTILQKKRGMKFMINWVDLNLLKNIL